MGDEDTSTWMKELPKNFLPKHFFYRAVPKVLWKYWKNKEKISPHIFITKHCIGGLSMDWSKYSTPQDCKRNRKKFDENTGVIQFKLEKFFEFRKKKKFELPLEHDPIKEPTIDYPFINRGHSLIRGIHNKTFKTVVELELSIISNWVESCKPKDLMV